MNRIGRHPRVPNSWLESALAQERPSATALIATRTFDYIDNYGNSRHVWVGQVVDPSNDAAKRFPSVFEPAPAHAIALQCGSCTFAARHPLPYVRPASAMTASAR